MKSDTSEKGLESLIVAAMTAPPPPPPPAKGDRVAERPASGKQKRDLCGALKRDPLFEALGTAGGAGGGAPAKRSVSSG